VSQSRRKTPFDKNGELTFYKDVNARPPGAGLGAVRFPSPSPATLLRMPIELRDGPLSPPVIVCHEPLPQFAQGGRCVVEPTSIWLPQLVHW
jgi:hypothetical protein